MVFRPLALYSCINFDLQQAGLRPWDVPPECSPRAFAAEQLAKSIVKKFVDDDPATAAVREAMAVQKFLDANSCCRQYDFAASTRDAPSWVEMCINGAREEISRLLWDNSQMSAVRWRDIYRRGYFGPGSSQAAEAEDTFSKLTSPRLSVKSESLYQQWLMDTEFDPLGKVELLRRFCGGSVKVSDAVNISTVLKNREIDRTIGTETSITGFYQLGLGGVFTDLLKRRWDIDLSKQQFINRHLAREGSATGLLATIDLSSASDTISLDLCRNILPREVFDILLRLRAEYAILPDSFGRECVRLSMVSSMGNGFTFPLQTIIFGSVIRSAYRLCGITPRGASANRPNWGVNGDDLICRSEAYNLVVDVLTRFGFVVNRAKSFNDGYFRESCGGDFFKGHYVRGVYIQTMTTPQDVVSAINRLIVWSARWDIPLPRSCEYLLSLLSFFPLVPPWESDDAGLHIPRSFLTYVALCKTGRDAKGRLFYRSHIGKHPAWAIPVELQGSLAYKAWAPRQPKRDLTELALQNEAAHMYCSIGGYTQSAEDKDGEPIVTAPVRLPQGSKPQYRLQTRIAPGWVRNVIWNEVDYSVGPVEDTRWSRAFIANLG